MSVRTIWQPTHRALNGQLRKNRIVVSIRLIPDKTGQVVFAKSLGNLRAYNYKLAGPTSTRAIIATDGQAQEKWYGLRQDLAFNPPGWDDGDRNWTALEREWDISGEGLVDRGDIQWVFHQSSPVPSGVTGNWAAEPPQGSPEDTAIDQAADDFLVDNAPSAAIQMDVLDTPQQAYGTHYQLGDKVTVIIDGESRDEVIQQVTFRHDDDGLRIIPVAGTPLTANTTPYVYRQLRKLWAKLTGVSSIESLSYAKLTIGISDPKNGEPKNGNFPVDGTSSEATPLNTDAQVKLMYREYPGTTNWTYTADPAQNPDTAGNWAFATETTGSGQVYRQFRAEITRVPTGEIQYTAPLTIIRGVGGTELEKPAVTVWANTGSSPVYKQGAYVRIKGYAAPNAKTEAQHRTGGNAFADVSLGKDQNNYADDNGFFNYSFKAIYRAPGTAGSVDVRIRHRYTNPLTGVEWVSDWQTSKVGGGALQYVSSNA
jgi:hypothetical protein